MTHQTGNKGGVEVLIHRFSVCVAIIGSFYAAPWIIKALRDDMYTYLIESIGYELAHWGSWLFVGVVILAAFFGSAAMLHLLLNGAIKKLSSRSAF